MKSNHLVHVSVRRGFTLIELLVVIAIIGILSAVILAALGTSRSKGSDAAVQSNLHTVVSAAELYYYNISPNSYGSQTSSTAVNTCENVGGVGSGMFTNTNIMAAMTAAINAGSGSVQCFAGTTAYAVAVQLKASTNYWCIDSAGKAKSITTAQLAAINGGAGTFATTALCP